MNRLEKCMQKLAKVEKDFGKKLIKAIDKKEKK